MRFNEQGFMNSEDLEAKYDEYAERIQLSLTARILHILCALVVALLGLVAVVYAIKFNLHPFLQVPLGVIVIAGTGLSYWAHLFVLRRKAGSVTYFKCPLCDSRLSGKQMLAVAFCGDCVSCNRQVLSGKYPCACKSWYEYHKHFIEKYKTDPTGNFIIDKTYSLKWLVAFVVCLALIFVIAAMIS